MVQKSAYKTNLTRNGMYCTLLFSTECTNTKHLQDSTHIWVSRWPSYDC